MSNIKQKWSNKLEGTNYLESKSNKKFKNILSLFIKEGIKLEINKTAFRIRFVKKNTFGN
jgi:hypothetical protein